MDSKTFDNSKFKQLRQFFGMNQTEFAEKLGTHQQIIAMIENNRRDVPKSIRAAFYNIYGISYEEAIKCKTPEELNIALNTQIITNTVLKKQHITPVKFFKDAKAAAGYGEMLPESSDEEVLYFDTRWLENIIGVKANNAIIIQAEGNSMYPNIQNGDLLLVDTSIKDVINNKIFVIQQGNDLRVKRLVKEFTGEVYLISDNNKEYSPELAKQDSNIIGRVVWNGSKENI